jgi:adenylate cyclase
MEKPKKPFKKNEMIIHNVISNMVGVGVIILLIQRLQVEIPESIVQARYIIDPIFMGIAFLIPTLIALNYERPIRRFVGHMERGLPIPGELIVLAHRRALNEPFFLIGLTLSVWLFSSVFYTALFWMMDAPREILMYPFYLSLFTGLITTTIAFFVLERVLQKQVAPHLFPNGGLFRTPGTIRVRIRTRLIAMLFASNFIPFLVILRLIHDSPRADEDPLVFLAKLQSGITTSAILFLCVGLFVTLVVSANLRRPLEEIIRVLQEVRKGKFDRKIRVTSNDEIGYTGDVINEMNQGLQERELIKETFGRYVSREIRDEILSGRIPLDGEIKEVTVLFADLKNFTPMVESTPPKDVVRIINEYFKEMNEAIEDHKGLVLQFIGDEIEAVFGAPVYYPDHADAAFLAARAMCERLQKLNEDLKSRGYASLAHRIGIHTGPVVAANIGSPDRLAYSLVGDTVNLAARLQDLNKEFGTEILLSNNTRECLTEAASVRALPPTRVKGKQDPVEIFTPG